MLMKNFVLSLLLVAFAQFASAKPRSAAESEILARSFFSGQNGEKLRSSSDVRLLYSASQISGRRQGGNEAFFIFGGGQNGFVVISGDDKLPPVLAFSDEGDLENGEIPDALKSILTNFSVNFENTKIFNAKREGQALRSSSSAAPLLGSIMYGQVGAFNEKMPEYNGKKAAAGCVAVVMAQIMKYYEYPERGTGELSYKTNTREIDVNVTLGEAYDWGNMLDFYEGVACTDAQKEAVSTLMLHCGAAVSMNYFSDDDGASGAHFSDLPDALLNNFGYDKNLYLTSRDLYTLEEWTDMLRDEIDNGRPVAYSGSTVKDGGHAFIIDGYAPDNFFHVNWGWSGTYNGFYSIDLLDYKPYYDGSGTSSSYAYGNFALLGIQPPNENSEFRHSLYVDSPISTGDIASVSRFGLFDLKKVLLSNIGRDFDGFASVVLCDENDDIVAHLINAAPLKVESGKSAGFSIGGLHLSSSVKNGKYKVSVAFSFDGENWSLPHRSKQNKQLLMEVTSSAINFSYQEPEISFKDASVAVLHNLYEDNQADFLLTLTNSSDEEYIYTVGLKLKSKNSDHVQFLLRNGHMPAGSSAEFRVSEKIKLPAGEYEAVPVYSIDLENYFAIDGADTIDVTILPQDSDSIEFLLLEELSVKQDTIYQGDTLSISAALQNVGAPYNGYVSVHLFKSSTEQKGDSVVNHYKHAGQLDNYLFWDKQMAYSFNWGSIVADTGSYKAYIYYLDESENSYKHIDSTVSVSFVVLPNELSGVVETEHCMESLDRISLSSDGHVLSGLLPDGLNVKDARLLSVSGTVAQPRKNICGNRFELYIGSLTRGVYILRIETEDNQVFYKKVIL